MKTNFLDKKNDIRVKITAKTPEELFLEAVEGLSFSLNKKRVKSTEPSLTLPIKVSSIDINSLLVDFLSEVLYQSDINKAVFPEIKLKRFTNSQIEADISGYYVNNFDKNIKSIDYRDVRVIRNADNLWQTEIIFNI